MPSLTLKIEPQNPLHARLVKELSVRVKKAEQANTRQESKWKRAEETVLAYVPESEMDAKRRTDRDNGKPRYTTMQLPYTYAMLMSAHTYWTSVFFSRTPIHQFMGLHGEGEQQTQALEALINYQITAGNATGPYYIWLYDAGKYGLGILGTYWDRETIQFSSIDADPTTGAKVQTTRKLPGYEGNRVYNVSPWDFFPDPRVTIGQFQKGEYLAIKKRLPWNDIVRREAQGFYMNVEKLKRVNGTSDPAVESHSQLERPEGSGETGSALDHPLVVDAWEVYVDLIPREWSLGDSSFPEKWVFTITKDYKLIFSACPLGAMHSQFPFDIMETEVEAYGQYNRGIPEIMEPIQNTMDWLINTHFFNTRAMLNNLFVVDPTKVVMKDFENPNPGGFIRLKPEAYGQDLRTFFHQVPMQDITQNNFNDLSMMQMMAERVLGVNDQIMGAMGTGGRKTATEIRTSTGFGVNRLKTVTEYLSATAFTSHAQKLVINSQQYYTAEKKFRIAGSLALDAGKQFVQVTPDLITGSFQFVPVDGTLPVDRMAQVNLWKEILMGLGRMPQIATQYDLGRIFAWMANLAGLKNINQFKIQVLPPGVGPSPGMVPVGPGGPPGTDTRAGGVPAPMPEMPQIN
jgi:hypothetical protein